MMASRRRSGRRRRYGAKIDYQAIPDKYRKAIYQDGNIQTEILQATMLHKCFAAPLNVVIIVKTNHGLWRSCPCGALQR